MVTLDSVSPRRPAGRRLTPEREAELYEAVIELLREVGYESFTMDALSARTHSSKATLYRQWRSKPNLVVQALRHVKGKESCYADTGSLRGDLFVLVDGIDEEQMDRDIGLMRGLAHAAHTNPDLSAAFRELLLEPDHDEVGRMLERAIARGEVKLDSPALEFLPNMLLGAFVGHLISQDRAPDRAYIKRYLDAVVFPALGLRPQRA
jgi:AcrR family transcriptional regulator